MHHEGMNSKTFNKAFVLPLFILLQSCQAPDSTHLKQSQRGYDPNKALVEDCNAYSPSQNQQASQYASLGYKNLKDGDFDSAINDLSLAIDADPNYYYAYSQRGIAFRKIGQSASAIDDYKKVENFGPKSLVQDGCLFDNMAIAYTDLGEFDIAISYHDKALRLSPNNPFIISNRGSTKMDMKNYSGAVLDFQRSLELSPEGPALLNIGLALILNGRFKESIKYLDQAIQIHQMPNLYAMRGLAYMNLDDTKKACNDLIFALKNGWAAVNDFVDSYCR